MRLLTPRQKQLWDFILEFSVQNGRIPRLVDMASHLGTSNRAVLDILKALGKKGYVEMQRGVYTLKLRRLHSYEYFPIHVFQSTRNIQNNPIISVQSSFDSSRSSNMETRFYEITGLLRTSYVFNY